jgi:Glycosyl transferases group 1
MRILVIGSRKWWRMESGVARALRRAGHTVLLLDDRKAKQLLGWRLTQRWALWHTRRFHPDFVHLSKCLGLELETVEKIIARRRSVLWLSDAPSYRLVDTDPSVAHYTAVGRLVDTFFVSGFDAEWRALGLRAKFLPSAGDREITPVPADPRLAADVTFAGTGYDAERARFLMEIADRYQLKVWGKRWERWAGHLDWGGRAVEGREFAAVSSSSAIMLGINPTIAEGSTTWASNRQWITLLAGGFYLGAGTPGVDQMLLEDVHCAWYTDLPSCLEKIGYYLEHPVERLRVRAAGEAFVREHHTYDRRIQNLLSGEAWVNPL